MLASWKANCLHAFVKLISSVYSAIFKTLESRVHRDDTIWRLAIFIEFHKIVEQTSRNWHWPVLLFVSAQGDRIAACLRGQVGWEPLKSRDCVSANFSWSEIWFLSMQDSTIQFGDTVCMCKWLNVLAFHCEVVFQQEIPRCVFFHFEIKGVHDSLLNFHVLSITDTDSWTGLIFKWGFLNFSPGARSLLVVARHFTSWRWKWCGSRCYWVGPFQLSTLSTRTTWQE